LLPTNANSTVPTYADEFAFVEYPYLLSKSAQRVEFIDTLKPHEINRAVIFVITIFYRTNQ